MTRTAVATAQFGQPFSEMNTTPLIDVLLVLLVMLILAVLPAINQVPVDLPQTSPLDHPVPIRPQNDLTVGVGGELAWNGVPLSEAALFTVLQQVTIQNPEPLVRLTPAANAPYDAPARVLRLIKLAGVTDFAFVGNERYASFGKAPGAPTSR